MVSYTYILVVLYLLMFYRSKTMEDLVASILSFCMFVPFFGRILGWW